ncbi:putative methyltransferase SirN-like protein [Lophiotrema nucula]|uniref:Putative methyltransferase SirN-like protein n=1 Tax=Lophiotrema nucula TaxID=690887 RepID=A0A6A5ZX32_9PLEO|nr:putative methyltransferase SirN-like protein [Lophiotrema nucula]
MSVSQEQEKYFMEGNAAEIQRLSFQHEVLKNHIGALVLAPVEVSKGGLRILDSATADGLWLRDLAGNVPADNTYVGTDIMEAYFPPESDWPSNMSLTIQSITKPWPVTWREGFDLVHQRFALPAAGKSGLKDALSGLIGLVKPGGWIQLVEADHSVFTGPAMGELFELVKDVFGAMDVGYDHARDIKTMFQDAGLEQVEERVYDVPLGAKNPDAEMGQKSAHAFTMGAAGIVGAAKSTPGCTFSAARLDALKPSIERELQEQGGVNRVYVVWACKPVVED